MKKLHAREWLLLLLPAVALGGYGLWTSNKKPQNNSADNSRMTEESVRIVPPKPADVFQGYDTAVEVKYQWPKAPEVPNAKLKVKSVYFDKPRVVNKAGKLFGHVGSSQATIVVGNSSDPGQVTLRVGLREVPKDAGELSLRGGLVGAFDYYRTSGRGTSGFVLKTNPQPFSIVVRKTGQAVVIPKVSKARPFILKSVFPDNNRSTATTVTLRVIFKGVHSQEPAGSWRFIRPRVVDSRGKEYVGENPVGRRTSYINIERIATIGEKTQYGIWLFIIPKSTLPKNVGPLTFKVDASLNDCWPLPISYTLPN